jgi:glycosyltransferase involved in cell wall biosynthesis
VVVLMALKFRLHLLGLPHTQIERTWSHCAYSMKVYKAAVFFASRGHDVTLYANEGSDVRDFYNDGEKNYKFVQILTEDERASWFGPHDPQKLYHIIWDRNVDYWKLFNVRCIEALKSRVRKGDFILSITGDPAGPVADAFPGSASGVAQDVVFVEPFVGYYGVISKYWAAESNTHREWLMGKQNCTFENNDTAAIPNYWDAREFVNLKRNPNTKPYLLFVGRVIDTKGWGVAVDVARDLKLPLIVAGQGGVGVFDDKKKFKHVKYVGSVGIEKRNELMTNAIATICATHFREPFGGTAVETQLCGTPAITTDHGAFCETVEREWRCASHREFVEAPKRAMKLTATDRARIKARAMSLYTFDAVAPQFERFFARIYSRFWAGWYEMRDLEKLKLP